MIELSENIDPGARIKVIGAGGCGGNAINHMMASGLSHVDFVSVNNRLAGAPEQQCTDPTSESKSPFSSRPNPGSCARPSASVACGSNAGGQSKAGNCSPTFMAGSPKDLKRAT